MQVILVSDREKQQINPSIQSTGAHLSPVRPKYAGDIGTILP
ncbi:MAG: hypothetical protein V7K98_02650 [Nostoc sp.]